MRHTEVPPDRVHETLRRHLLVDGYPIVVDLEHSRRSWLKDRVTGKDYLDFFSFFASNPLGFTHQLSRQVAPGAIDCSSL